MSILSEQMKNRLEEVRGLISRLEKELSEAPEGRLRVSMTGGQKRLYHVLKNGSPSGRFLHRQEEKLARQLAQKDYDRKVLVMLREEEKLLGKTVRYYENAAGKTGNDPDFFYGPEELLWSSMVPARKQMTIPVEMDTEMYADNWLAETYEKKDFRESDAEYTTSRGIRVRSKTELIIAQMLESRDIPFFYEKPLYLQGQGIIHPDFTVLNRKRRKTMFWEHMGMMDDEQYRDHALERVNHYILAGYYPGVHLILSHETSIRPVRTRILENIIEQYLEE